ncbi:unnamed protein product [Adineta ricciae]|uniref:Uncharacterized protein n=1 Tax=Adineta ricciae TaxID=249248 RepID=A0A816DEC3_ADIRI|nr:unnamed protein product [Adineta ricciae]
MMMIRVVRWIGKHLSTLNWFESDTNDFETVRRERLSTRVYICLIIILSAVLIIYTGFKIRTDVLMINHPNLDQFEHLFEHFSATLRCSCSQIAIPYETFVKAVVHFHPVCSSSFVSFDWIRSVYAANITYIWPMDTRTMLSAFWQLISAFCRNIDEIVTNSISDYNASTIFSPQVFSSIEVETRAKTSLDLVLTSAQTAIARTLLTIRRVISGNQLISGLSTNANLQTSYSSQKSQWQVIPKMNVYDNCSCMNMNSCVKPSGLYQYDTWNTNGIYNDISFNTSVLGMMFDCYPIDAVLASTLQCYFTSNCLERIHPTMNVTPLSLTSSSQFDISSTIQTILDELFIDRVEVQTSFVSYYTHCSPSIFVGIMGGAAVILKLLSPLLVKGALLVKQRFQSTRPVVESIHPNSHTHKQTFIFLLRSTPNRILEQCSRLNIFDTYTRDANVLYRQRMATRVYFVCLFISIIILGFYTLFSVEIKSISMSFPSQDTFTDLYAKHRDSLKCECSQLSISYSEFIQITPSMHQLCSSEFISPTWYNQFFQQNLSLSYYSNVYDPIWPLYFPLLQSFCFLINRTITDSLNEFAATSFINNEILPRWQFDQQAQILIDTFTNSTVSEFTRMFALIRNATAASQFVIVPNSNGQFTVRSDGQIIIHINNWAIFDFNNPGSSVLSCTCNSDTSDCVQTQRIYDNSSASFYYLTGLYIGCLTMDGLMVSTLECWFDSICFNKIRRWLFEILNTDLLNITPLDVNLPSRFPPRTPINQLMNELFLENWNINTSYEKFYSTCKPKSCDYTEEERYDIIYALLTIIATSGGLSKGLKMVVPWIVRLALICFRWKCKKTNQEQNNTTVTRTFPVYERFRLKLLSVNWFGTRSSTIETLHRERLYTRIYIVLSLLFISILIIFTGLSQRSDTKSVANPSIEEYERLESLYTDTLQCPCSKIALANRLFITQLEATLHPVCLSSFVNGHTPWIYWISGRGYVMDWVYSSDFRRWGSAFFIWIGSFCTLANITIKSAVTNFQSESLLVNQPMTRTQFEYQINLQIDRFLNDTRSSFVQTLKFYQDIIQGNALMSFYATNWIPVSKQQYNTSDNTIRVEPITYNSSCSCATSHSCLEPAGIYAWDGTLLYVVEGVQHGCSLLESYLASSLSCFYSNSCLVSLFAATALGYPNDANSTPWNSPYYRPNFQPLNRSSIQHFSINDTFSTIVNELFIDTWSINISYESFFNECAARYCTYSIVRRFDFLYVVTTFLSLFTGISFILRLVIPRLGIIVILLKTRIRIKPVMGSVRFQTEPN